MAILKNDEGLIQLHECPKCEYLVMWPDTVNDKHLCKWCAAQQSVQRTAESVEQKSISDVLAEADRDALLSTRRR